MNRSKTMIDYAMRFIGLPYIWGGDDPIRGFDCSGFIQETLASVGLDPKGDQTAQGLYYHFVDSGRGVYNKVAQGSLLFFGKRYDRITHVAMAIDALHMIEAGGGNSKTKSSDDAIDQNAYIRVRPILSRSDLICVILPTLG